MVSDSRLWSDLLDWTSVQLCLLEAQIWMDLNSRSEVLQETIEHKACNNV